MVEQLGPLMEACLSQGLPRNWTRIHGFQTQLSLRMTCIQLFVQTKPFAGVQYVIKANGKCTLAAVSLGEMGPHLGCDRDPI